jgi:tetratricopeptide (TPR) repeat protein
MLATMMMSAVLALVAPAYAQSGGAQPVARPIAAVQTKPAAGKAVTVDARAQAAATEATTTQAFDPKKDLASAATWALRGQYQLILDVLSPLVESSDPDVKWQARYWVARGYQGQRNLARAIPLYDEVVANYPSLKAQCLYQKGVAFTGRRRYQTAHGYFAAAFAAASPDFQPTCLYQWAYTHYLEKHYERATTLLERFVRDYPKSPSLATAQKLLEKSRQAFVENRRVEVGWVANVGANPVSELLKFAEDMPLATDARVGLRLHWSPHDGTTISTTTYATQTSYLTGDYDNRQALLSGITVSHDRGNLRTLQYGASYSYRNRVTVVNSDQTTYGLWGSYATPLGYDGRLSVGVNVSSLRYPSKSTSGSQTLWSASYSEPLSPETYLSLGASYTDSNVGAKYLSTESSSIYGTLTNRISKRRSIAAGYSYTARAYDAPRPKQKLAREELLRREYVEYTQRITDRVSVSGGWQETKTTSNFPKTDHANPTWYVRLSNLLDLKILNVGTKETLPTVSGITVTEN